MCETETLHLKMATSSASVRNVIDIVKGLSICGSVFGVVLIDREIEIKKQMQIVFIFAFEDEVSNSKFL